MKNRKKENKGFVFGLMAVLLFALTGCFTGNSQTTAMPLSGDDGSLAALGSTVGNYEDIAGFCKSATLVEIEKQGFVLTPGRYVGIPEEVDDGIPFEDKMKELTTQLAGQMREGVKLDEEIKKNLESIGFKVE